jgi:hypothetical protein
LPVRAFPQHTARHEAGAFGTRTHPETPELFEHPVDAIQGALRRFADDPQRSLSYQDFEAVPGRVAGIELHVDRTAVRRKASDMTGDFVRCVPQDGVLSLENDIGREGIDGERHGAGC